MNEQEWGKYHDACKAGRVEFSDRAARAVANLDLKNPDRTLTTVKFCFWGPFKDKTTGEFVNQGGMGIDWESVSAGCGRCDFRLDNDGKMRCYDQHTNKAFILQLLQRLLDETELDSEHEDHDCPDKHDPS